MIKNRNRIWDISREIMYYPDGRLESSCCSDEELLDNKIPDNYFLLKLDGTLLCYDGNVLDNWESNFVVMRFVFNQSELEIYENDIIELDSTEIGGDIIVGEVVFNTDNTLGNIGWCLWNNGYIDTNFMGRVKVLGNTYQTSDYDFKI